MGKKPIRRTSQVEVQGIMNGVARSDKPKEVQAISIDQTTEILVDFTPPVKEISMDAPADDTCRISEVQQHVKLEAITKLDERVAELEVLLQRVCSVAIPANISRQRIVPENKRKTCSNKAVLACKPKKAESKWKNLDHDLYTENSSSFSGGTNSAHGSSSDDSSEHHLESGLSKDSQLSWSALCVEYNGKVVLKKVSGRARPGELTAIMGHSGSGKTTLIKALTGCGAVSSGKVSLNGTEVNPSSPWFQRAVPCVADRETLESTATCLEVITFSASLRLPSTTSTATIEILVRRTMEQLKLAACANTQCRFMSVGERRRLSVAVELVVNPATLVLDEPTSGLDSFHGVTLMRCLKQIAERGTSVLFSIHHPNRIMWEMLNHVLLLHKGRVLVQGDGPSIVSVFERHGYQMPLNENPADWILAMSQSTGFRPKMKYEFDFTSGTIKHVNTAVSKKRINASKECEIIMIREWRRVIRDAQAMIPRLFLSIVGGAAFAIVFAHAADTDVESVAQFSSHAGALFFLFLCASVVVPSVMKDAIAERPVFEREYRTGHYRIWTYIICKTVSDALVLLFLAVATAVMSFFAIGFRGRFWYLTLIYFFYGWVFTLIAVAVVAASRDPASSVNYVGFILLPQALLSGFYVSVSELPSWLFWAPWTMPFTWAFRLALEEEFSFCAIPSERDSHLLGCMEGLQSIFHGTALFNEESVYTLEQAGRHEGASGAADLTSIASSRDQSSGALLYDACYVRNNLDIAVNSVSEEKCSITVANVVSGRMNPSFTAWPELNVETVLGFRFEFSMTEEGALFHETHAALGNSKNDLFNEWLDSDKVADEVCDTLETVCDSEYFATRNQCVTALEGMPAVQNNLIGVAAFSVLAKHNTDLCSGSPGVQTQYNFTSDDELLFQKVGYTYGFKDGKRGRAFADDGERGECLADDIGWEVISSLQENDEFEDINTYCYAYLQENDATAEYTAVYWTALLVTVILTRVLTAFCLRFQAHRYHRRS